MDSKQLERVRQLLLSRRQELADGFTSARERGAEDRRDEGGEDYIDAAVSSYTKEFLYSLSDLERNQLNQVDRALGSLDEGTYGTCNECGEEIEEKRLKAVPWAEFCLSCQDLADRGLLQPRMPGDTDDDE